MFRQRQLYDKSIHIGIIIQLLHFRQKFFFGHITFVTNKSRFETANFTSLYFCCNIGFTTPIVPYQNRSQMWTLTATGNYIGNFSSNFLLYLFRNLFSIN